MNQSHATGSEKMRPSHNNNSKHRAQDQKNGFTLIELLIVVAIILIIAGIAIPNLLRARIQANEASGVANLRTITTASVMYSAAWDNGYPPALPTLGGGAAS